MIRFNLQKPHIKGLDLTQAQLQAILLADKFDFIMPKQQSGYIVPIKEEKK